MPEPQNPSVSIDQIIQAIQDEATRRSTQPKALAQNLSLQRSTLLNLTHEMESLASNAELRAHVRSKWPDKLSRFPFNLSKPLQKAILKVLDLAFRDQREVNLNLIYAFRKSLALQRSLIDQLSQLETAQAHYESQLVSLMHQVEVLRQENHPPEA